MERTQWYKDMVFYQIWPRSFMESNGDSMGNLPGVDDKLNLSKSLGIKVIMDLVLNHTSDEHEWFRKNCYFWLPRGFDPKTATLILQNYPHPAHNFLQPYETRVYLWET